MTNLTLATPKSVVRFSALSLLTAALLATPFRAAAEVSDFQYVTNNGTLTITRYTGTASSLKPSRSDPCRGEGPRSA